MCLTFACLAGQKLKIVSCHPKRTVFLAPPPPSPLASCSNIGKTDPNSALAVSQSCQRPQGIPQQGRLGSDRLKRRCLVPAPGNGCVRTVVSLSCHLSPLFIFSLLLLCLLTRPQNSTITCPLTNFHSHHTFPAKSLHLSRCSLTPPSPPDPTVSHPTFTFTPTGSQRAPRLPPSDRLCRHHGSPVLSKRRLGPRESLTFYPFSFVLRSAFLTELIDFILTFIIISNGEENHYSQVKINPCIDCVRREKRKTCARPWKVKSKCAGSASPSCPVDPAALSGPDESRSCGKQKGD